MVKSYRKRNFRIWEILLFTFFVSIFSGIQRGIVEGLSIGYPEYYSIALLFSLICLFLLLYFTTILFINRRKYPYLIIGEDYFIINLTMYSPVLIVKKNDIINIQIEKGIIKFTKKRSTRTFKIRYKKIEKTFHNEILAFFEKLSQIESDS